MEVLNDAKDGLMLLAHDIKGEEGEPPLLLRFIDENTKTLKSYLGKADSWKSRQLELFRDNMRRSSNPTVRRAVRFLTNPSVVHMPLDEKISYLRRKGLTVEEIEEAFKIAGIEDVKAEKNEPSRQLHFKDEKVLESYLRRADQAFHVDSVSGYVRGVNSWVGGENERRGETEERGWTTDDDRSTDSTDDESFDSTSTAATPLTKLKEMRPSEYAKEESAPAKAKTMEPNVAENIRQRIVKQHIEKRRKVEEAKKMAIQEHLHMSRSADNVSVITNGTTTSGCTIVTCTSGLKKTRKPLMKKKIVIRLEKVVE